MTSAVVEALHVLKDDLSGLPACLEAAAFHTFPLERSEKRFRNRIIITVAGAAHAHADARLRKHGSIRITRVL